MADEHTQSGLFAGAGDVRTCLRTHDWSESPLGPPSGWPPELLTVVSLMLNSKFPMFVAWGPDLALIYNDEYVPMLGDKHPACLGGRMPQVWSEIWPVIAPIAEAALEGRSVYFEDLPLSIKRRGYLEQAWFTFSYSPLENLEGQITGLHCVVAETTAQVEVKRGQAFQLMLSDRLRHLNNADEIVATASGILGRELGVSRVLYAECDDLRGTFFIRRDWNAEGVASIAGEIRRLDDFGPAAVKQLRAGERMTVADVASDPLTNDSAAAYASIGVRANLAFPLVKNGVLSVILSLHDANVRHWSANEISIASDMAERTWSAVENARAQASLLEANQRKDEFLAMLAHELRNPLAPISAAAELMEKAALDAKGIRRTSEVIGRQVRHMTGLLDDLLDVSRVTRGQVLIERLPQDMAEVVASAVEQARPLMQARRHELGLELGSEQACVLGDHNRLVQVLTNILNNAAKYTPDGGRIRLRMETTPEQVKVSVQDNGIGIAHALQPRVFDLFAQAERTADRSQGGLGLGLALVKSLVELHDGAVSCSSAGANLGSTFEVRLPRYAKPHPPMERRERERSAAPPSRHHVMIVDDNEDAAIMLGMLLEASGHDVVVQNGSLRALEAAGGMRPAVCILDIGLPEMDGYELARRMRKLEGMEQALLIAVTGYGQEDDRRKALDAGFDHHMVKPVDAAKLLRIVGEAELGGITS